MCRCKFAGSNKECKATIYYVRISFFALGGRCHVKAMKERRFKCDVKFFYG